MLGTDFDITEAVADLSQLDDMLSDDIVSNVVALAVTATAVVDSGIRIALVGRR